MGGRWPLERWGAWWGMTLCLLLLASCALCLVSFTFPSPLQLLASVAVLAIVALVLVGAVAALERLLVFVVRRGRARRG